MNETVFTLSIIIWLCFQPCCRKADARRPPSKRENMPPLLDCWPDVEDVDASKCDSEYSPSSLRRIRQKVVISRSNSSVSRASFKSQKNVRSFIILISLHFFCVPQENSVRMCGWAGVGLLLRARKSWTSSLMMCSTTTTRITLKNRKDHIAKTLATFGMTQSMGISSAGVCKTLFPPPQTVYT